MQFVLNLAIISAAVCSIMQKVDVRLALLFAALALIAIAASFGEAVKRVPWDEA